MKRANATGTYSFSRRKYGETEGVLAVPLRLRKGQGNLRRSLAEGEITSCGCQSWRVPGPPKEGWRPRRNEPRAGYASNAELTELILAWQKEEEPERLLAILAKLAPLTG